MDTHYYPINLVPHGALYGWFFILWQQIDWRMLSSLFVLPGVPCDRVGAMHRARGERWDKRKDHSVWIEAKFTSTMFFTCSCLHSTVSIPKETGDHPTFAYYTCVAWAMSDHSEPLPLIHTKFYLSSTTDTCQVCKYMETPKEMCYAYIRKLASHLN